MGLSDRFIALRDERLKTGATVPDSLQGVSKGRVRAVLGGLALDKNQMLIDCVYALLDDETPSFFARRWPTNMKFSDGATTAMLACHIGFLQGDHGKHDREGRDQWIKPLRDLGGIEAVTLIDGAFVPGHPIAKSGNSSYRLSDDFVAILRAPEDEWQDLLRKWAAADATRARREFQAVAAEASKRLVGTGHASLIDASIEHYAKRFLPGYEVLYVDDSDGDRISDEERAKLARAGVEIKLDDPMPDVLLWNPKTDRLWVIEAVTSDGEVDIHKVKQVRAMAERCGKAGVDFTTTYLTWKDASSRQGKHGNIAVDTYLWILADPAKHWLAGSFN
ncbi:hypothetical protein HPY23_16305 [Methylobacterium sp. IF7SW-B2]|jgi:hypothetical protein|nr:hypothetical protein [Methylobacterium ajmalii]MBK3406914.1 hypothetical protein [Methylobacterium ajmalii]MBK3422632.1 hypothetical protein [Methylobacterium ajmalii]